MILLIDNYDSFAYNLYQMLGSIDPDIEVVRNDEATCDEIAEMAPGAIVLSPGPGRPEDAGICVEAVQRFAGEIPILGVCLGHQAICKAFGARIGYAHELMHGKSSRISQAGSPRLLSGLPRRFTVARYHSLSVEEETLPEVLSVTAKADDGEVMAVEHKEYPVFGVQFHPESVMTKDGMAILRNFVEIAGLLGESAESVAAPVEEAAAAVKSPFDGMPLAGGGASDVPSAHQGPALSESTGDSIPVSSGSPDDSIPVASESTGAPIPASSDGPSNPAPADPSELLIHDAIIRLSKGEDLSFEEAEGVMDEIMDGRTSKVQTAAYLTALAMKGETVDEITASAAGMRAHCVKLLHEMDVLEIVGTGGDGSNSFNISTTSSMVIAAGGVPVAKHGNRAASSKCGAADVLEALGVNIDLPPERSTEMLESIGICFLFAQNYHIAMKYVAPVRRELGIRTVFNILGPLSNPAGANRELMGVYEEALVEPLAQVMAKLGVVRGMVVFGQDGLDEISMSAPTSVCEIRDGWFQSYEICPEDFGYERCSKEELVGGDPQENAEITRGILEGRDRGPKRMAVCLNAGAALYIGGAVNSMEEGVRMAEQLIDSGAALRKLEEFRKESTL